MRAPSARPGRRPPAGPAAPARRATRRRRAPPVISSTTSTACPPFASRSRSRTSSAVAGRRRRRPRRARRATAPASRFVRERRRRDDPPRAPLPGQLDGDASPTPPAAGVHDDALAGRRGGSTSAAGAMPWCPAGRARAPRRRTTPSGIGNDGGLRCRAPARRTRRRRRAGRRTRRPACAPPRATPTTSAPGTNGSRCRHEVGVVGGMGVGEVDARRRTSISDVARPLLRRVELDGLEHLRAAEAGHLHGLHRRRLARVIGHGP